MPKSALALLLFVSCAADASDDAPESSRNCGGPLRITPAEICALQGSSELIECVREPYHYTRRRDGLLLSVQCHVYGHLPDRGAQFSRYVDERDDVSIVRDLRSDWSDWPKGLCDLTYTVASLSSVQQSFHDFEAAKASMWVDGSTVIVSIEPPFADEAFVFGPGECATSGL